MQWTSCNPGHWPSNACSTGDLAMVGWLLREVAGMLKPSFYRKMPCRILYSTVNGSTYYCPMASGISVTLVIMLPALSLIGNWNRLRGVPKWFHWMLMMCCDRRCLWPLQTAHISQHVQWHRCTSSTWYLDIGHARVTFRNSSEVSLLCRLIAACLVCGYAKWYHDTIIYVFRIGKNVLW